MKNITFILILVLILMMSPISAKLCDENCTKCNQDKDGCLECEEDKNRELKDGSCVCNSGYFENRQLQCESDNESNIPLYIFLCVVASIIFIGILYNIARINPLNLCDLLPQTHKPLLDKKVHVDDESQVDAKSEKPAPIEISNQSSVHQPEPEEEKKETPEPVKPPTPKVEEEKVEEPKKDDLDKDLEAILNEEPEPVVQQEQPKPKKKRRGLQNQDVYIQGNAQGNYTPWAVLKKQMEEKKKQQEQQRQKEQHADETEEQKRERMLNDVLNAITDNKN